MYPKALKSLMDSLEMLPGVGEKTAERLALFIVSELDEEQVGEFSNNLINVKEAIKPCPISFVLTDEEISPIITDELRNKDQLMIVSDSKDVFTLEKMETFKGQYHVLGGLIDFSRGITDKDLNINSLLKRIKENKFSEVIVATNATVEGELTANYLKSLLSDLDILTTRLAYGIPVGSDLKYADVLTLIKAVENRRKY